MLVYITSLWNMPHLQTDSIKSMEAPLYPYIRILKVEFKYTTLFL
jgi:hypothetical protein